MPRKVLVVLAAAVILTAAACRSADKKVAAHRSQPVIAEQEDAVARKIVLLDGILASGNDNDSRLDTEFTNPSSQLRAALRAKYAGLPREARNSLGTIVFLLGRRPTYEDWSFFAEVVAEPPCLSLADCSRGPALSEEDIATGVQVTLAYPALVALKQAEYALRAGVSREEALRVVNAAETSKVSAVSEEAARLKRVFPR